MREPYGGDSRRLPGSGVEWSREVLDMAEAIRDNRPQRISGAQAAHVEKGRVAVTQGCLGPVDGFRFGSG